VRDRPLDEETPDPLAPDGGARLDLDRALAKLSPPERLCVGLCHGAGLTQAEIAEALQVPLGTVKSHVTRGLAKLRVLLGAGDG
jgi:RNA polymerase sigma-70 factor (ECF subfamily)